MKPIFTRNIISLFIFLLLLFHQARAQNCETDINPPIIICPENVVTSATNGDCDIVLNLPAQLLTDNCGLVAFSDGISSGEFLGVFSSGGGLDAPYGLIFGPDGHLYVSSGSSDQILKYNGNTGAFIEVFAAGGGLDFPVGLDFGPDGNLYVSSFRTHEVLRYDGQTGDFIDVFASGNSLLGPSGLSFGPDGLLYLYVSSATSDRILRFDGITGDFVDIFAIGNGLDGPIGLDFGKDGNLFVSSYFSDQVLRYDGQTGDFIEVFTNNGLIDGEVDIPYGIVFGADNNLYVANYLGDQILKYDGQTGVLMEVFAEGQELDGPLGITFGLDGNLYVSSRETDEVLRYNSTTGDFIDVFASGGGLDGPYGLVFGPDDDLYVASRYNNQIIKYDGITGDFIEVFATGNGLDFPVGIDFGEDNDLYVASFYSDQVLRFDGQTGDFINVFAEGNGLSGPSGLLFDNNGNLLLFVASAYNDRILKYDGNTGDFMGEFAMGGGLDGPIGMAIGPDYNLYVSSYYSDQVLRYNGQTGEFIDIFTDNNNNEVNIPYGISFGPDGNLYVSSYLGNQVLKYNGGTGTLMEVYAEGNGLEGPLGLIFGPDDHLYVSSGKSDQILKFKGPQINTFPVGTTSVSYLANDEANNQTSCSFSVTITDNEAPSITCPENINTLISSNSCEQTVSFTLPIAADNCGNSVVMAYPPSGSIFAIGTTSVQLIATDDSGNTAECFFEVNVEDNIPPQINCPSTVTKANDQGECGAIVHFNLPPAIDNCAVSSVIASQNSGSFFPLGDTEVSIDATDQAGNVSSCTFIVNVFDNEAPIITCPNDITVNTLPGLCEGIVTFDLPIGIDNCDPPLISSNLSSGSTFSIGQHSITIIASDQSGNTGECNFDIYVIDNEPPNIECNDKIVQFNGEPSIEIVLNSLVDNNTLNDNCGFVELLNPNFIENINCSQIGELIEITVIATDDNGNNASCNSQISVEGLPCGFSNQGGIGCNSTNLDFDNGAFTLNSDGCSSNFPYTQDAQAFIQYELCGDGFIKAHIDNILGDGFAGIQARETNALGAKKVALSTNTINKIKKEIRIFENYPSYPQYANSFNKSWLKIERTNNVFIGSISIDDAFYQPFIFQSVQMSDCILVGLFVNNDSPDGLVEATFSSVEVGNTNNSLNLQQGQWKDIPEQSLSVFPNPAGNEFNIDLKEYLDREAVIKIINMHGQIIQSIYSEKIQDTLITIDSKNWPKGIYWIQVQSKREIISHKLIIQ
jgi:streptogramin lyase